jgi:hypothetical protein
VISLSLAKWVTLCASMLGVGLIMSKLAAGSNLTSVDLISCYAIVTYKFALHLSYLLQLALALHPLVSQRSPLDEKFEPC